FVSTQNSDGYGDVKRIKITSEIEEDTLKQRIAERTVAEDVAKSPIDFELRDSKTGASIAGTAVILNEEDSVTLQSDEAGQVAVPYSDENVSLEFKAPGYLSVRQTIDQSRFMDEGKQLWVINLEPLSEGNTITLNNVLFYKGTANFIEGSEGELELVAEMMNENPEVNIFLKGHTDNVGNDVLNVQLSQARVEAVTSFLVDQGVAPDRISGKGFGGSQPVASNETEETRKLNRRVEFEIRRD
ncbi:MAG: OmpA family protein, partial [Bacteroidetes bacterium]|nr:OmpA family protein [Bacteroidota bacterium]